LGDRGIGSNFETTIWALGKRAAPPGQKITPIDKRREVHAATGRDKVLKPQLVIERGKMRAIQS